MGTLKIPAPQPFSLYVPYVPYVLYIYIYIVYLGVYRGLGKFVRTGGTQGTGTHLYLSHFCLMSVSFKNEPVVDRLILLLNQAKITAAAIADNCIDDQQPIDTDSLLMISRDILIISDLIEAAYDVSTS